MKHFLRSLPFYCLLCWTIGCTKLKVDPSTQVPTEDAGQRIDLMLVGAYSLLGSGGYKDVNQGGLYGTDLLLNADLLASEGYLSWGGTFTQYKEIQNKQILSTNNSVTRMWQKGYAAINLCNLILLHIGNAPPDKQALYAAEARFIKAVVYFELLRFFGESSTGWGIPLVSQPTETYEEITFPSRATMEEVYATIISELEIAKTILPKENGTFANRHTATAYLARVFLQKGDYARALTEADTVLQSSNYQLASSVDLAFNTSHSKENIFEIPQTINNNTGLTDDGLTTFYNCDENTTGSPGRGDISIDSSFIARYDSTDDRRMRLIYQGDCENASFTSKKWNNPYAAIPVLRLAELYLIRAECNQRLGTSQGATPLEDVNTIRARAHAALLASVSLDSILTERELELAFEGFRIHDFRRTGKKILSEKEEIDYTSGRFVFPIPQSEMNVNKNLIQNSHYR